MCYIRELNFPTNRKKESVETYGGVGCVSKKCHGVDSWSHLPYECHQYETDETPIPKGGTPPEDIGKIPVAVHQESVRKWSSPLFNIEKNI